VIVRSKRKLAEFASQNLSLLVEKGDCTLFASHGRRLEPLLQAIMVLGQAFQGAAVIDKMLGGAAAKLLVYARVRKVLTPVASKPAVDILQEAGIPLEAVRVIDRVRRNDGGFCRMEALSLCISDPVVFYTEITRRLDSSAH